MLGPRVVILTVVASLTLAAAEAAPPIPNQVTGVAVIEEAGATLVRITTSQPPRYRVERLESPPRLVLDFDQARYGWRKVPLDVATPPVRQLRGSQYQKGVARVVIELTTPAAHSLRAGETTLDVLLATSRAAGQGPSRRPAEPSLAALPVAAHPGDARTGIAPAVEGPSGSEPSPVGASTRATLVAQAQTPAPAAPSAPTPVVPAPATGNGGARLISLDFKDADVVNLLRILAAESGRNIVISDDVKGKMSISLRNVPWELALDTILESRALQKLERDGVIRIVSTEQLTKEREAKARVEEAKLKAEAEVRQKIAEAQLKEAEAQQKKLAAEAAAKEAEARGPLREETIRLSYADPEEVAKTLQGILGIPAEGVAVQGPGFLSTPVTGPIAEPPFSQLFGPRTQAQPQIAPMSVSQDVLAKGLTIRAHKPTNTLFLRLYSSDLDRVKKLIHESFDIPLPQVKIEARMEILDRQALEAIGVQWGGAFTVGGDPVLVGQGYQSALNSGQVVPFLPGIRLPDGTFLLDPTGVSGVSRQNPNFLLNRGLPVSSETGLPLGGNVVNLPLGLLPNSGTQTPAAGISFGIIGTNFNINLALQALEQQGKTRTLARPEVVTVENARAIMSLGEEIPYATISSAGTQIQFKEALLKLDVVPTVIREGDVTRIKMIVVVENNSRGDPVNLGPSGTPPAINRRKAETQVLIKEGERLVIGGVAQQVNQNTVRRVPFFGELPLIGHLFKARENFETGRELVVFVTPSVLRAAMRAGAAPGSARPAPAASR